MIDDIVGDLRAVAQRCSKYARDCRGYDLSRALEELAIELTMKAAELEGLFGK